MSGFCGAAAGLVHSSTSDVPRWQDATTRVSRVAAGGLLVDRNLTRLKKMSHGVLTAARLQGECASRQGFRYRAAMITLTYGPGEYWEPRHLSHMLKLCREYIQRAGHVFRYVWVAEMQQRGAVHYHVLVWLPVRFKLPKPDERGWWPFGMSNICWAKKAAGYLAKYCSKGQEEGDPKFPRGIRISGVGGLDKEAKREHRWWRAPSEARDTLGLGADIRRIKGGRFDAITGLFWESRWVFLLINGKPYIVPKGEASCLA